MSLRYGLVDLLSAEPRSGYDLAQFFTMSMGNVWPAQHSQIYPELAKLVADGLIAQTGEGPRGRKVYQATPEGIDALRTWLRETEPDYSVKYEALLRVFCLWVLPQEEAIEYLRRDRLEYQRHLDRLKEAIADGNWDASPLSRSGRLAIEFGRRFYQAQVEWVDWAIEQVQAGILSPGGPIPEPVSPDQ
jgi:DNA-binding PadR family transcriptional regulator